MFLYGEASTGDHLVHLRRTGVHPFSNTSTILMNKNLKLRTQFWYWYLHTMLREPGMTRTFANVLTRSPFLMWIVQAPLFSRSIGYLAGGCLVGYSLCSHMLTCAHSLSGWLDEIIEQSASATVARLCVHERYFPSHIHTHTHIVGPTGESNTGRIESEAAHAPLTD